MRKRITKKNKLKHGLGFELAKLVFADPLALILPDTGGHHEERWRIVGSISGVVIALVVYTVHQSNNEIVRIISARRATRHEREDYEEG